MSGAYNRPPMSHATRAIPNPAFTGTDPSAEAGQTAVGALIETTKPGITRLVSITALVGLLMGAMAGVELSPGRLIFLATVCTIGTALASGGANALNMWLETSRDARMRRTAGRPLPSGRLRTGHVAWFGAVATLLGVLVLALGTGGPAPALVALACAGIYVLVYTPLKPVTAWNTIVGTIPGALPPLIGTAAVSGEPGLGALGEPVGWALFALMTVWQLPHFYAIAWLHREDYERGGFRMLSRNDASGARSAWAILSLSILLIPAMLAPAWVAPDLLGLPYVAIVCVTGVGFVVLCARFFARRDRARARGVFIASIMHLPLVLIAMVAEAAWRTLA